MSALIQARWPVGLIAVSTLLGCGANGEGLRDGANGNGAAQGNGGSAGTGDVLFGSAAMNGAGGGGTILGVDECGGDVYQGEGRELDMFIMMDRSGSMLGIPFVSPSIWIPIGTAIGTFVTLPEATGIGVGIGFFPIENDECNVSLYATPVAPIAPLPGNANAIQQAIASNGPGFGETPTVPAMQGAVQYAQAWATQNPSKKVIVVLATDGEPNACNSDIPGVSQAAATGLSGTPSVPTYVIGIGNIAGLNEVAVAGGTNQAFIVDADPNVASQQFVAAMNQIRGLALPCDYALPSGADADPTKVNLDYTPPGGTKQRIGNAPDASGCDPSLGGWYYNNNRIYACPASCNQFAATPGGVISVVVGCPTELIR